MLTFLGKKLRAALYEEDGLAAIEFAMTAPILVAIYMTIVEFDHYSTVMRRAHMVSSSTTLALAQYGTGQIGPADRLLLGELWTAMNPTVGHYWRDVGRNFGSITFTATPAGCTGDCVFEPKLEWAYVTGTTGVRHKERKCDPMTTTDNDAQQTASTVPRGFAGPVPIVFTDLTYTYAPLLLPDLIAAKKTAISKYQSTRSGVPLQIGGHIRSTTRHCGNGRTRS